MSPSRAAQGLACGRRDAWTTTRTTTAPNSRTSAALRRCAELAASGRHAAVRGARSGAQPRRRAARRAEADVSIPVEPIGAPDRLAGGGGARAGLAQRLRRGDVPHRRWPVHQVRTAQLRDVHSRTRPLRLEWAGRYIRVPHVLEVGRRRHSRVARDAGASPARAPSRRGGSPSPQIAVRAVGEGLRALHDALPVAECPFDWSVASRIANAGAARHPRARRPARAAAGRPARRLPCGCLLPEHAARRRRPLDRARRPRRCSASATAGPTSRSRR